MRIMMLIIAVSLIGGGLGACASSDDQPVSCHGARRAANPYGSVLQAGSPSASAPPGPPPSDLVAPSSNAARQPGRVEPRRPCGRAPS